MADVAVKAIMNSAKTKEKGSIGGGKIFVVPLESAVRIRAGGENDGAL